MDKSYSVADARDQLPRLLHEAEDGQPVTITRRGKPVAVLLSLAQYQRLTVKPGLSQSYQEWREAWDGEFEEVTLEDLRDRQPGRPSPF
ncbi:MAG: type II toxin-antitoxin system Phd/YefM family antitoxin [Candidatus Eremiobacteraeota bacterium]|nr:type II toxin-antitoxin system Phd/YefM family antitoxin [Candidatus Eremiobacteraeota bacterium]